MYAAKHEAEKDGLTIEVVEYGDYLDPNIALTKGEIEVNSFQHLPFLDAMKKDRAYDLVPVAKTVVFPMGIYSKQVKAIADLEPGAVVGIPSDPVNCSRALLLLEKLGLIKLRPGAGDNPAVVDISENPKSLEIRELEASQISRSLADFGLAAVNVNYAQATGLVPARDAIVLEGADSPYAHIIAVRAKDKDKPAVQKLIKAYHSDAVKKYIQEYYKGSVVPTW